MDYYRCVFSFIEIPILGCAWWIYFTALKGRRSGWRTKASLINLILTTFCGVLLLLAVAITPEKIRTYDYVAQLRGPAVLLSLVTLVTSFLGTRGLGVLTAAASLLSILSWVFSRS